MKLRKAILLLAIVFYSPIILSAQVQSDLLRKSDTGFEIRQERTKNGTGQLVYSNKNMGINEVLLDNLTSTDKIIDAVVDSNKCLIILKLQPSLVYYIAREKKDGQWKSINGSNIFWTFPSPRAKSDTQSIELIDINHLKVTEGSETNIWEFDKSYQKDRIKTLKQ